MSHALLILVVAVLVTGCNWTTTASFTGMQQQPTTRPDGETLVSATGYDLTPIPNDKADELAKASLDDHCFRVTRGEATEQAGSHPLNDNKDKGVYACVLCKLPLYTSEAKFESGTGWPSFYDKFDAEHVREVRDESHGMVRVEVECARCGSHLGHVFEDGPPPTGLRFCINGAALAFFPPSQVPAPDGKSPTTQPATRPTP